MRDNSVAGIRSEGIIDIPGIVWGWGGQGAGGSRKKHLVVER